MLGAETVTVASDSSVGGTVTGLVRAVARGFAVDCGPASSDSTDEAVDDAVADAVTGRAFLAVAGRERGERVGGSETDGSVSSAVTVDDGGADVALRTTGTLSVNEGWTGAANVSTGEPTACRPGGQARSRKPTVALIVLLNRGPTGLNES